MPFRNRSDCRYRVMQCEQSRAAREMPLRAPSKTVANYKRLLALQCNMSDFPYSALPSRVDKELQLWFGRSYPRLSGAAP